MVISAVQLAELRRYLTAGEKGDQGDPGDPASVNGVDIDMADQILTRPTLKDFAEATTAPAISVGALTLDMTTGNVFAVTLTENVTTLTLSNPPTSGRAGTITLILTQDGTGGRTVTWPGTVTTPPVIDLDASVSTIAALLTVDGGVTWHGFGGARPKVLTQAEYDALTPVDGQLYLIEAT